jgi:glycosyltransferase involved in cell wall biosynthesis
VDAVLDGETGLLAPHGDPPAMVEALVRVLSDSELRARLERGAIAYARTFTWDRTAAEALALSLEVAARGRRR